MTITVAFEWVLVSLAIPIWKKRKGKSGSNIQFEQQEIQEKHPVPQKLWTWFSSKSDLQEVLAADEIVLYMWCSVKMQNPPASTNHPTLYFSTEFLWSQICNEWWSINFIQHDGDIITLSLSPERGTTSLFICKGQTLFFLFLVYGNQQCLKKYLDLLYTYI